MMRFSDRTGRCAGLNAIAELAGRLADDGVEILNLSDSNPTRHGLSPGGVLELLSDPCALEYRPDPRGLLSARAALAARSGGEPRDYFLSASTSEAYSWLFKLLCDPGDTILVPRPGYPLFDQLAVLESVIAEPYRLEYSHPGGWRIDMDGLKEAADKCDAKAVIVINPNNPTGSYVSGSERIAIINLCAERGMALIADEVFFQFALETNAGRARFAGEQGCLCFALDGLSKLLCLPQLKLGWMRISGPEAEVSEAASRLEFVADAYLSAGAPVMNALPSLLGKVDVFGDSVRRRLRENLAAARSIFGGPDSACRILRCDGAWTALLEYPRYQSEEETVLGLLRDEHLAVQPGFFFDMERDGYLALSLILRPEAFRDGAMRLRRYIDAGDDHKLARTASLK